MQAPDNSYHRPEQDDFILRFLTSRKTRVLRHAVSLLMLFLMTFGPRKQGEFAGIYDYLGFGVMFTFLVSLLYINMYVLIPRFFYRGRYTWYLAFLALTIWLIFTLLLPIQTLIIDPHRLIQQPTLNPVIGIVLLTSILIPFLLISTALKLFQRWIADSNRLNALENTALQSELKALRNQINPHFLFNMLNNIYVLIRKDADMAAHLTLKLSDFLRYLLHEGNQATVFLSAELKFITDLLELEKMRRDTFEFTLDYHKSAVRGVKIPSHILITLVENALKHSHDAANASYVRIAIELEENTLRFSCANTVPTVPTRQPQPGGLGLANLSRRLELLYQQRFSLTNSTLQNLYVVELNLPL